MGNIITYYHTLISTNITGSAKGRSLCARTTCNFPHNVFSVVVRQNVDAVSSESSDGKIPHRTITESNIPTPMPKIGAEASRFFGHANGLARV